MFPQHKEHIKHITKLKGNILEIGVCKGNTTKLFLDYARKYGGQVLAIDPLDNDEYYSAFKENILDKYQIDFYRLPSTEAFKSEAIKHKFNYAYIDGSHTYEDCLADLINVHKLISNNGIVCFDDTNLDEVKLALNDVLVKGLYKILPHNNPVEHKEYVMLKVIK